MPPIVIAAFAILLSGQEAPAQAQDSGSVQLPPVDVDGRLENLDLETRVDSFVDSVAAPVGHWGPARWDWRQPLCIAAVNFQPEVARQLIDRVGHAASLVELRVSEPGCRRPKIIIFGTNDGPATAQALLRDDMGRLIGRGDGMALGDTDLEAFQTSDRPIRWWHVNMPVDPDTGQRVVRIAGENAGSAARSPDNPGTEPEKVSFKPFASRLYGHYRNDLRNVVIIVDTTRLGDVSFSQWADYVAMVALTQVAQDMNVSGHDSVLAVFDRPVASDGLTDWDRSFLQALYTAQLDSESQVARMGAVEREMEAAEARRTRDGER